jgi:hypothetical protein
LIYRDENGVKKTLFYDRPEVSYYIIKDKESPEAIKPPMYIENYKVQEVKVYSDLLLRDIASKTNALGFYEAVATTKGIYSYDMHNIFKHPWIYGADMDLSDRYIAKFQNEYDPDPNYKLHKCYFDIEVDLMPNGFRDNGFSGFPDEDVAPCPVNVITLIDGKFKKIYTFVNHNPLNKSLEEFAGDLQGFQKDMADQIFKEDNLKLDVNVIMCEGELNTIEAFFKKIHEIDPDYVLGWNCNFDIITLINRLRYLYRKVERPAGVTADQMMLEMVCDSKYAHQKAADGVTDVWISPRAFYQKNETKKIGSRLDNFMVLDGINWEDQMLYYAVIHFSEGKRDSYRLDAIANFELKKEKLPFAPGETVKNLPWKNFRKFTNYNMHDALLLLMIEDKTLDIDLLQTLSEITNTRKEKVFSKSISLPNFINKYSIENGFIMSGNKNADYGDYGKVYDTDYRDVSPIVDSDPAYTAQINHADKYGALVSDPNLNEPVGMMMPSGKRSNRVFENVCDQDLSSLYPSILRTLNLDSSTEIGKFILVDDAIKSNLKKKYGYSGLFKLSEKDDGAGQIDDVSVPGEDESAASDDTSEDDSDILSDDKGSFAETSDLGPTLSDEIESQNWCRLGEKYMFLPSVDDNIKKVASIIAARKAEAGK